MKIDIENYRGWDIVFDTEKDQFQAYSNAFDNEKTRQSFSLLKKTIDEFIKYNAEFKPFKVRRKPGGHFGRELLTVIGIRKDGRFMIEVDGKKEQLSSYDEDKYIVDFEKFESTYSVIESLRKDIAELERKERMIIEAADFKSLAEYKQENFGI